MQQNLSFLTLDNSFSFHYEDISLVNKLRCYFIFPWNENVSEYIFKNYIGLDF